MKLVATAVLAMTLFATTAAAGPPLRLWVKNASTVTIDKLYIEIMGTDWGAERLRGKTIEPKGKMQFMLEDGVDKCVVDLKLLSTAGKEYSYRARLCEDHTFTFRGRP
ncbi:hypothetical protein LJR016_002540 [Devosia sp. LjRoot16]|jgi:hypothetical protein|uniref:hypothetical protein n=1 Tax=Devosia sp. LjRoot16 TaxID=3342271 RepID=UPI003ED01F02